MAHDFDLATHHSGWHHLESGTIVDRYMIERFLAEGGFSLVYLARQLSDQHQVAIKEYLPKRLAHRTWHNQIIPHNSETNPLFLRGRQLFFEEARVLAKLKHPNIVEVLNFFQANSTAYMVMTYDYGKNLAWYLTKGRLTARFMLTVFPALLGGLKAIHSHGLLHLDIKPGNILIRPEDNPLLLDFGAVHPYPEPKGWKKPGQVRTQGFSPIEQYRACHALGPWSDLYAIGATMRACLDGANPPPALERTKKDTLKPARQGYKGKYPQALLEAIDWAMQIDPSQRPQSVAEFLSALSF